MRVLTRDELLLLVGLTSSSFDQLSHAGYVALAFGTPVPGAPGRYLDLDAVAVAISEGLTPSLVADSYRRLLLVALGCAASIAISFYSPGIAVWLLLAVHFLVARRQRV